MTYKPENPVRVVTAASLFDGHDASINIVRRVLQDLGAEVIHLGHNQSVQMVVKSALQEGAQAICVSSYQGGHVEYFKYMKDLLREAGAEYVKVYGGGGGVIVHREKKELEDYGIDQIFHPDDGRKLGLEGMMEMIVKSGDYQIELGKEALSSKKLSASDPIPGRKLGVAITALERGSWDLKKAQDFLAEFGSKRNRPPLVVGMTGTGGAGKSSLIDELLQRFLNAYSDVKIGVICVDPTKKRTGGSLLGDRIRMNSLSRDRLYMRSLASRGSGKEISDSLPAALDLMKSLDFDLIIAETSGIGQASSAITEVSDLSLYVMTSEFGAQSQLEKIDMIDYADLIAINKADRRGARDALRDVRKQFKRSRKRFDANDDDLPVFLTQASQFNDRGVNQLFFSLTDQLREKDADFSWNLEGDYKDSLVSASENVIVPADRENYLAQIVKSVRDHKKNTESKAKVLHDIQVLSEAEKMTGVDLSEKKKALESELDPACLDSVRRYEETVQQYSGSTYSFQVREKTHELPLEETSLSGLQLKRVSVPRLTDWGDRFRYLQLENVPGQFPFTAGVFPLKRKDEDPKRMFAGEGTPERTNSRFHFLCEGERAKRLSTAFDSVTLYGEDPNSRPDIYGKVGESGVSICTLEDMKKLYAGFDLCDPLTSVSMTINGPAPIILAFYFNTAIDQQVEKIEREKGTKVSEEERQVIAAETLQKVRGTVQADILKEDQGQNTCIFSIQFALKMMGDIQQYFVENKIRNFYSVSISGYHIAEAGANPISQLAFTLSNGFTFVEYYLSRGMKIDDFAPNLSFFFSNGLDAEYTVLGRVARRIWAIAMKDIYKGNERSQKLKYHIQTSGRSLHAQEIDFNDIRTTLQALIATYDNCNSLHTNAYDEAITTPTQESVRRAMAIQMIINREFGMTKNENPLQGAYFVDELTELVEEAVLEEFLRINERGGVLGAMETQYQRGKIQEESLYYEELKHSGELPIIGVNTYINPDTLKDDFVPAEIEMARASNQEKQIQLNNCDRYKQDFEQETKVELKALKTAALKGENIFEALMSASRVCSLGQISNALYEVGGQYRRNL